MPAGHPVSGEQLLLGTFRASFGLLFLVHLLPGHPVGFSQCWASFSQPCLRHWSFPWMLPRLLSTPCCHPFGSTLGHGLLVPSLLTGLACGREDTVGCLGLCKSTAYLVGFAGVG